MHLAVKREDASADGFSLSPVSLQKAAAGDLIALPSPNGATCCTIAKSAGATTLCVAGLVNARATAQFLLSCMQTGTEEIWVVACGERTEPQGIDEPIRFAIEDYLGAGAILDALSESCPLSPEASLCASAFRANINRLDALIAECESGLELIARNCPADVHLAGQLNLIDVPVIWGSGGLFAQTER